MPVTVTIGGVPPTTEQQEAMRVALGLPEPFDLTATKLTLVGSDKVIGLDSEDSDTPKLFTLNGIATFAGAAPDTVEGTMAAAETGADVFAASGTVGGGGDLNIVQMATPRAEFGTDLSLTFGTNVVAGNHVLAALFTDNPAHTFSSTLGTQDSTGTPGGGRVSGFRTNNVATPATVFEYSLSSGWNFGAVGIEVSGNAPVFDAAVYVAAEGSASGAARTVEITVAEDNSIVLVIFGGDNERTFTLGGGLTGGSHGTARYIHAAYGKFAAGPHTLSLTPESSLTMSPIGVFIWSPGA